MKFTLGLLTGVAIGAAGAVAYSVTTGRDLRDVYEQVRTSLADTDGDRAGLRLDARFADAQARIEDRIAQVRRQVPGTEATAEVTSEPAVDVAADVAAEGSTGD